MIQIISNEHRKRRVKPGRNAINLLLLATDSTEITQPDISPQHELSHIYNCS